MVVRNQELGVLKKSAYLTAASSITWTSAPFLVCQDLCHVKCTGGGGGGGSLGCNRIEHLPQVALVTFATYALVHKGSVTERLTPDRVFVALSLFNLLSFPLSMLPTVISNVVQVSATSCSYPSHTLILFTSEPHPHPAHIQATPSSCLHQATPSSCSHQATPSSCSYPSHTLTATPSHTDTQATPPHSHLAPPSHMSIH